MKKKLLLIIGIIIVVLAIIFAFVIYPKMVYKKDINIIKNKIVMVNDYLINNTGDIKSIKEELSSEKVSSKRLEIEKETNNYLNSILEDATNLKNIVSDNKINHIYEDDKLKDNLDDVLKYLKECKDKLDNIKMAF